MRHRGDSSTCSGPAAVVVVVGVGGGAGVGSRMSGVGMAVRSGG